MPTPNKILIIVLKFHLLFLVARYKADEMMSPKKKAQTGIGNLISKKLINLARIKILTNNPINKTNENEPFIDFQ